MSADQQTAADAEAFLEARAFLAMLDASRGGKAAWR